ncbi:MAG: ATP-dependent helicase HrpB [Steroidobacteraceae bacterium]
MQCAKISHCTHSHPDVLNASHPSIPQLPIHAALPNLLGVLQQHSAVVLQAPPGAGKSTGVPLALLDSPAIKGKILMLEPRRIAARSVALRMASTLGETAGQTVGYRTRLDTKVGKHTRIEVVTEGILTRMLQHDAALEGIGIVIFDEFHERSLQADLGLALCLDVQATLRDDLKLLVMSATLDGAAVAKLLGDAPIVTSQGQSFPVTTHYRAAGSAQRKLWQDNDITRDVAATIARAVQEEPGDVLVFLPGQGEIRRVQTLLQDASLPANTLVLPLYGELSPAEQDRAIAPSETGKRKIVLATNIAETSLTIDGVRVVIDSGLERRLRFDPVTGMNALELLRISRAAADQRRGRAGRTQTGVCYRLWQESEQDLLTAHTTAEILESDLLPLTLELAAWGIQQAGALRWLDAPPAAHFTQARELLSLLGALDKDGKINSHGRAMAQLGTHPRLAHMLIKARELQLEALAIELTALLGERDLLRSRSRDRDVDLRSRIEALHGAAIPNNDVDQGGKQRVLRSAEQLARQLRASSSRSEAAQLYETGRLLALAYPDRIAQKRGESERYLLSNGSGAVLNTPQSLSKAAYLVVAQLDASERDARIQLAAPIELEELETDFVAVIEQRERIEWNSREAIVTATQERRLGALTLASKRLDKPDTTRLLAAMLQGIRELSLTCLPWSEAAKQLRTRMQFAHQHDRQGQWPNVDDAHLLATLEDWLAPWLDGISRRSQLQQLDMHQALIALLSWDQQQHLNDIAPTHIRVPSGSNIALDYSGAVPTLSVRLQEVFGMTETPRVGGGSVPVLMELLSPARRPVQVTQDLASFWARGYHDVKKDLKGRYPKHYWPDDPLQAEATARAKPRGT